MILRKQNSQNGFTFIELLIIVAMTSLITTVMLANFRLGERQKRAALAADTLISAYRQAQNFALSGRQIPDNLAPVSGTACAAGTNTSAIYYRVDLVEATRQIDLYAEDRCGAVFLIQRSNMPEKSRIKADGFTLRECNPACVTSYPPVAARVKFEPPFGRMTLDDGVGPYAPFQSLNVVIESTDDTGITSLVMVDGVSGRIER